MTRRRGAPALALRTCVASAGTRNAQRASEGALSLAASQPNLSPRWTGVALSAVTVSVPSLPLRFAGI